MEDEKQGSNATREITCCFTGHRKIDKRDVASIKNKTLKVVLSLIQDKGVRFFGAGGALGFDTIAAEVVLEAKKSFPQVKLILVLPCKEQTARWQEEDIAKYNEIMQQADKYVYTSEHHDRDCMYKRNRHLVNNSKYCICYLTEEKGGTAYTVKEAEKKGLTIYNVAEM